MLRLNISDVEKNVELGDKYYDEGKYQEAITAYYQAIQAAKKSNLRENVTIKHIDVDDLYDKCGMALYAMGQYEKAAQSFLFAISIIENNIRNMNGKSSQLEQSLLKRKKDQGFYQYHLGMAYLEQYNQSKNSVNVSEPASIIKKASEAFIKALEYDPGHKTYEELKNKAESLSEKSKSSFEQANARFDKEYEIVTATAVTGTALADENLRERQWGDKRRKVSFATSKDIFHYNGKKDTIGQVPAESKVMPKSILRSYNK